MLPKHPRYSRFSCPTGYNFCDYEPETSLFNPDGVYCFEFRNQRFGRNDCLCESSAVVFRSRTRTAFAAELGLPGRLDGSVHSPAGWNVAWMAAGRRRDATRLDNRLFDKPGAPACMDSGVFRLTQSASRTGVYAGDICLDAQPVPSPLETHPSRSRADFASNPLAHLRRQPQRQRLGVKLVLKAELLEKS